MFRGQSLVKVTGLRIGYSVRKRPVPAKKHLKEEEHGKGKI